MRLLSFVLCLFMVPVAVRSCEGPCIVGITDAFLGNYTKPINEVMELVGTRIVQQILPNRAGTSDPMAYLHPILQAYNNESYAGVETAVFPSYFHGKCQQNGVDPPGCPDPDCPVVCGTPGSLVHFYAKLRELVFDEIQKMLKTLATPGSDIYQQVLLKVKADASGPSRRMIRVRRRSFSSLEAGSLSLSRKRAEDIDDQLKQIMDTIPTLLDDACGGLSNGLPSCSWETAMKSYILSFP